MVPTTTTSTFDVARIRSILETAHEHPWTLQDIGLLGLRLDDRREYRLHVWAPERRVGGPVIHDHPFDFVSRVIVGRMVNTRYVEDPSGPEYIRERYTPGAEDRRVADTVRLVAAVEVYGAGEEYAQAAAELHDSDQVAGTVTLLRRSWVEPGPLTVCRPEPAPWVSGVSRPATPDEVTDITGQALKLF